MPRRNSNAVKTRRVRRGDTIKVLLPSGNWADVEVRSANRLYVSYRDAQGYRGVAITPEALYNTR